MQRIEILAKPFFEKIKQFDLSMWDMMEQMIDGEEKEIIFLDENNKMMMRYVLPISKDRLKQDQAEFTAMLATQMANKN